jgi:hypothetical protein
MKTFLRSLSFSLLFFIEVVTATAQNKYLLLEYVRLKPGITDSSSIIANTRKRLQEQQQKDHSVLQSTLWQSANPNNKAYQYIVITVFKNFNDYMSAYKNADSSKVFYSMTKGRLDTVTMNKNDSFEIVYTPMFQILADAGSPKKTPQILLNTRIKAASGKEMDYESLEMSDWLSIHKDLIKKGYESAFGFNKLIFPFNESNYNYTTMLFFDDETMFDKQDDIDYQPYMQANQSAFINSGRLRTEAGSDLLILVTILENGGK